MMIETTRTFALTIAASALLSACASDGGDVASGSGDSAGPSARTSLYSASGVAMGMATIETISGGLRLTVNGEALPPGTHGIHVHMVGKCEAPGFTTAGAHWNPTGRMHGRDNPQGAHAGDLPNLIIGTDGRGSIGIDMPGASLTGGANPLLDADGAALVIHADPDDMKTDPSGNSGGRIACGVLSSG